jgi:hypothetical protein
MISQRKSQISWQIPKRPDNSEKQGASASKRGSPGPQLPIRQLSFTTGSSQTLIHNLLEDVAIAKA